MLSKKIQPKPSDIFECKKCGDCCKGFGGTFVSQREISEISTYIGVSPTRFLRKYCQMSGKKPVLAQGKNGYCVFFDGKCSIHPVKPHMCKAWPFISAVLEDVGNWHVMAQSCKGIRKDFPNSVIIECVRKQIARQEKG